MVLPQTITSSYLCRNDVYVQNLIGASRNHLGLLPKFGKPAPSLQSTSSCLPISLLPLCFFPCVLSDSLSLYFHSCISTSLLKLHLVKAYIPVRPLQSSNTCMRILRVVNHGVMGHFSTYAGPTFWNALPL